MKFRRSQWPSFCCEIAANRKIAANRFRLQFCCHGAVRHVPAWVELQASDTSGAQSSQNSAGDEATAYGG